MVRRTFNLKLGEVGLDGSANLSNGETFTAKKITNIYFKQNFKIRPSTTLMGEIPLNPGDVIERAEICSSRRWVMVPVVSSTKDVTLYIRSDLAIAPFSVDPFMTVVPLGKMTGNKISYTEVAKELFNATLNPISGKSAILISGLDQLYYIDDDKTKKIFKVKTLLAPAGIPFPKPIGTLLFQGRLFIAGEGVPLASGATTKQLYDLFGSCVGGGTQNYTLDNFTIVTTAGEENEGAFSFQLYLDIDEELYTISKHLDRVVITTSRGIELCSSGSQENRLISFSSALHQKVGNIACFPSFPVIHDSVLVYPSISGLRQQIGALLLQEVFTLADTRTNVLKPIIPQELHQDMYKNNILAITKEGAVKALYWYGPAGETMAMTTYYESDYRPCLQIVRTPSRVYDLLILKSEDGTKAYIAQESDEISCRDLSRLWSPQMNIVAGVGGEFSVTGLIDLQSTEKMHGCWLEHQTNDWRYAYRKFDDQDSYQLVDKDFRLTDGTYRIIPHTDALNYQIPADVLTTDNTTEGLRVDVFSDLFVGGGQLIIAPGSAFRINGNKSFYGSCRFELSYWFKNPCIEWFSGGGFPGAPTEVNNFVLLTSIGMNQAFDILKENAGVTKLVSQTGGYCSHKFANNPNVAENITHLTFRNKEVAKDEDINIYQFFPVE